MIYINRDCHKILQARQGYQVRGECEPAVKGLELAHLAQARLQRRVSRLFSHGFYFFIPALDV